MVLMGAVLALIKQSFALVWICIVVIVPLLVLAQNADPRMWRTAAGLMLAAVLSCPPRSWLPTAQICDAHPPRRRQ